MDNNPTADPAGQEPPVRPIEYVVDYFPDGSGDGLFDVQLLALTSHQVAALLRAARMALRPPVQGAGGRYFVATAHAGGRRKRQKSNITPKREREIKAFMASLADQGLSTRAIAAEVEQRYPGTDLERKHWNHVTVAQWLREVREDTAAGKDW